MVRGERPVLHETGVEASGTLVSEVTISEWKKMFGKSIPSSNENFFEIQKDHHISDMLVFGDER